MAGEGVTVIDALEDALEQLRSPWSLVLVDDDFAGGSGMDLVEQIASRGQAVALMARQPSLDLTIDALRRGARDVLPFPPSGSRVRELYARVSGDAALRPGSYDVSADALIGENAELLDVFREVARVATTTLPVLLQGEPGVGKESAARAIHENGARADQPFVIVNCNAMPDQLLISELFGHTRDAPGVFGERIGRLERAHGGTLFLDEVDAVGPVLQARLLAALRDGFFEPVGEGARRPLDIRLISASDRDLQDEVRAGRFRQDLFDVMGTVVIRIPALRERGGDVLLLARRFLEQAVRRHARSLEGFDRGALDALRTHSWPGNVRQLRKVIEQAVVLAPGKVITRDDLALDAQISNVPVQQFTRNDFPRLEHMEREHIRQALHLTEGRLSEAATLLGIHRNTLRRKIEEYRL
jgi:DNA-binding NtrC family response regulator